MHQKRLFYSIASLFLILFSSSEMQCQNIPKTSKLFNGINLDGWKTTQTKFQDLWYVKDSTIHCGDGKKNIPANTYLHTTKEYENFEFRCLFRISGDPSTGMINSGIQYRSIIQNGKMIGYQADIGDGYWGDLYDEHRRGTLEKGNSHPLDLVLRKGGWNSYIIRVQGNLHQLYINGVQTVEYIEKDSTIPTKGVISVQNHSGGNSHVEFRNLTITELPWEGH